MSTQPLDNDIALGLAVRKRLRLGGFGVAALICSALFLIEDEHLPLTELIGPMIIFAGLPGGILGLLMAELACLFIPSQWRLRRALVARRPAATWLTKTRTVLKYALVLGLPAFMLAVTIPLYTRKNLQARVAYAWQQTDRLRVAVEDFHREHRRLPADAQALGALGHRTDYPDGGYFQLATGGRIRISFTVKADLRDGTTVLTPHINASKLHWVCAIEGAIEQRYLPHSCRE
jgi:hypothetical protein